MRSGSDGSATVWALIVVLVTWTATAIGVLEVAAVQQRHRAGAAADAAALAAAGEGGLDPVVACAAARAAAAQVGGRLRSCAMSGPYAVVAVAVPSPDPIEWLGPVVARARAGPAGLSRAGQTSTSQAAS